MGLKYDVKTRSRWLNRGWSGWSEPSSCRSRRTISSHHKGVGAFEVKKFARSNAITGGAGLLSRSLRPGITWSQWHADAHAHTAPFDARAIGRAYDAALRAADASAYAPRVGAPVYAAAHDLHTHPRPHDKSANGGPLLHTDSDADDSATIVGAVSPADNSPTKHGASHDTAADTTRATPHDRSANASPIVFSAVVSSHDCGAVNRSHYCSAITVSYNAVPNVGTNVSVTNVASNHEPADTRRATPHDFRANVTPHDSGAVATPLDIGAKPTPSERSDNADADDARAKRHTHRPDATADPRADRRTDGIAE